MPGSSMMIRQAIGPKPKDMKKLMHMEANPSHGKIKVEAHMMEGGSMSKHEHMMDNWGEAHAKMGEYMTHGMPMAPGEKMGMGQEAAGMERDEEPQEMEA